MTALSPGLPASDDGAAARTSQPLRQTSAAATAWLTLGLVFLSFALFAVVRAPIPGVNEPHYLCKAKHLWDPAWCARDQFLQSANAHAVFLRLIGAATLFQTLEQTAWTGRILVWLALAYGWTKMLAALGLASYARLWAAWAFLGLAAAATFSGEWVIGGVEAKGFAYACLFVALGAACAKQWHRAAIFSGLSISLHPVVGGWALVAGAFALLWAAIKNKPGEPEGVSPRTRSHKDEGGRMKDELRPGAPGPPAAAAPSSFILHPSSFSSILHPSSFISILHPSSFISCLLLMLFALPGLVPAVRLLQQSPSSRVTRQADEIQVFVRLDHHLNPRSFPAANYAAHAGLIVAWLILRRLCRLTTAEQFFYRFVLGTILIAVAGLGIGLGPALPGLMKFYPFRLGDVMVPVACAIAAAGVAQRILCDQSSAIAGQVSRTGAIVASLPFLGSFILALLVPSADRNPSQLPAEHWKNWIEACRWVEREVSPDALFLTPRFNFAFKWYAERAEYVAYKDCPQDAPSLVEWKRRLDLVREWRQNNFERGFTDAAVARLHEQTDIDHIIAWRRKVAGGAIEDPYFLEPIYYNDSFAVYRVPPHAPR